MIKADTNGSSVFLAPLNELSEEFPRLLVVRVEVAGIYADLLHDGDHGHGNLGGKVDIGHKGSADTLRAKPPAYFLKAGDVLHRGHGDADKFRARGGKAAALGHRCVNVRGMRVAHCLDHNGVAASYKYVGTNGDSLSL